MPNNVDVDSLSIVMTSDVASAVRGLNRVDKALKQLIVTYHEGGFENVKNAINSIAGANVTAGLSNATKASKALQTATEAVTFPNKVTPSTTSTVTDAMEQEAAAFRKTATEASKATTAVNKFANANKKATGKVAKDTKKDTNAALQAVMKFTKKLSFLTEMIKRRLLYRAINGLISAVQNGFKEGVNNLYQWALRTENIFVHTMDTFATAALYLKNSLGALVSPILNYLAPAIDRLNDRFVDLLNIINKTIAQLTGASTWTRALKYPKSYAEMLDDASGKAKKLKATILGIDEINPLNGQNNGGRGSGDEELDYSKMFEEVELVKTDNAFTKMIETIRGAWDKYLNPIYTKLQELFSGERMKNLAENFTKVFTDQRMQKFWDSILGTLGGVFNILSEIINNVMRVFADTEAGSKLLGVIFDILNMILALGKTETDSLVYVLKDLDLSYLVNSVSMLFAKLKETLAPLEAIVKHTRTFVSWIEKPVIKWLLEVALPSFIEMLTYLIGMLDINPFSRLTNALKLVATWFLTIYDTLASVANGLVRIFANLWNSIVPFVNKFSKNKLEKFDADNMPQVPTSDSIREAIRSLTTDQVVDFVADAAGKVAEAAGAQDTTLLEQGVQLLGTIAQNSGDNNVTISSDTIAQSFERTNRRNGATVVAMTR